MIKEEITHLVKTNKHQKKKSPYLSPKFKSDILYSFTVWTQIWRLMISKMENL